MADRDSMGARGLRWHLRNNWSNEWKLGPVTFEVEWVPKARQFSFVLDFDFSGGRYDY